MQIIIKNGRIINPATKHDKVADILICEQNIVKISGEIKSKEAHIIDASGKIVSPGFIDLHAHLREPGREDKETIETGLISAVTGGFTSVCPMPNTQPACDNQAQVKFLLDKSAAIGLARILPVGAITKGRQGKEMTEMCELKEAGCLGVSDDGDSVEDPGVLKRAMEYASMAGLVVMVHCEDKKLASGGVMNEGYWSTILGLRPIPQEAESIIVERDIQLARRAGARLHIQHVSTRKSIEAIREAKRRGDRITAEATPHHFTLTDEDLKGYDTNMKVNPPLRSQDDVQAVKEAIADGTIDAIATDHAPHCESEKEKEFDFAPFGMIGFETALSLSVTELLEKGMIDWKGIIEKMSYNPARVIGYRGGNIAEGEPADITVIDPEKEWEYTREKIRSKSSNSPFIGRRMKAAVTDVIVGGQMVLTAGKIVRGR
ncbi:MAG: dihydroorotase [Candidatus Omnitrophica bacterium]|jgi:dihydroorotase|nr:dihydroorotase [Candidatus Omnitrophota bacterium]MDD4012755.1 dihydroorotase [Candidatus Omnitrophota bacterium]